VSRHSEKARKWIDEFWADAPPLTAEQRDLIAVRFRDVDWGAIKAAAEDEAASS
jgi:hypothetical protein